MFEIPTGARHLLIQEADTTSHHLGESHSPGRRPSYSWLYRVWAAPPGWEARLEGLRFLAQPMPWTFPGFTFWWKSCAFGSEGSGQQLWRDMCPTPPTPSPQE